MALTPKQFNLLATKEDLKDLEEKMATKNDINKVLTAVDGIAKSFEDHKIEHISNQVAHDRFEERITNTEQRVKVLERKY